MLSFFNDLKIAVHMCLPITGHKEVTMVKETSILLTFVTILCSVVQPVLYSSILLHVANQQKMFVQARQIRLSHLVFNVLLSAFQCLAFWLPISAILIIFMTNDVSHKIEVTLSCAIVLFLSSDFLLTPAFLGRQGG